MDMLQQQQEHAEALRLAAEQAALAAQAEQAGLKGQLHKALRRAAQLDDQEQAVQAELDARLLEQAQHAEQLRCVVGGQRRRHATSPAPGVAAAACCIVPLYRCLLRRLTACSPALRCCCACPEKTGTQTSAALSPTPPLLALPRYLVQAGRSAAELAAS